MWRTETALPRPLEKLDELDYTSLSRMQHKHTLIDSLERRFLRGNRAHKNFSIAAGQRRARLSVPIIICWQKLMLRVNCISYKFFLVPPLVYLFQCAGGAICMAVGRKLSDCLPARCSQAFWAPHGGPWDVKLSAKFDPDFHPTSC